jgi:hypothetical protein
MGQSSAAPETGQRESKRLWQRAVDLGVATIASATITGLFTLMGIGLADERIARTRPAKFRRTTRELA